MQQLTFTFNAEQINIILAGLNQIAQGVSRPVTDYIVNEANKQTQPQEKPAEQ